MPDGIRKKPALFLDRDGVINVDSGYVHLPENFIFIDGIFDLCREAIRAGMTIIVVTNQAGIGRGYYTEEDFRALSDWMCDRFAEQQVEIGGIYYCPHHPLYGVGHYKQDSPNRKPRPGMILQARDEHGLDLSSSKLIGDHEADIAAAKAAGVGTSVLISESKVAFPAPDVIVGSVRDAIPFLFPH